MGKEYTSIDRRNIIPALESRLSARQPPLNGPQVQLFRINSPPKAAPPTPTPKMSDSGSDEGSCAGEQQQHGPATKPVDDVVFMLQKRIQIMQSIIDQLRASIKERQHWEEDAKTARQELERARRRIGGLEDERGRRGCAGEPTHDDGEQQRDAEAQEKNENSDTVTKDVESPREPGHGCTSLGEPLTTSPPETQEPRNDTIRLHHVVWGSSPVLDERLYKKLSQHATAGSPFTATRDFIGRDVEPGGRRTLVLAYSRPPGAPARWLVVDEGQEGRFGP